MQPSENLHEDQDKVMEIMPVDRKKEEMAIPSAVTYSDDTDATWIKKGKRPYYGYTEHVSADAKEGYVPGGHVTPAVADTTELEKLVAELNFPEGSMVQSHSERQETQRWKYGEGCTE
jgi:IS5 family transposase